MPVAPVKGVHGKQRWENAQFIKRCNLVLAHGLAMDQNGSVVHIRILLPGHAHGINEHVDGCIAIGVGQDLPAVGEGLFNGLRDRFIVNGSVAAVILGLTLRHHEIRLAQKGRLALRRAVDGQLDPADPETAAVAHGRIDIIDQQHIRIGHQVNLELTLFGDLAHGIDCFQVRSSFLQGRVAERSRQARALDHQHFIDFLIEVGRQLREQVEKRIFFHHAVGLVAVGLPPEHAPRGIRRFGGHFRQLQGLGVGHSEMAGLVNDDYGIVGRDRVELLAGRMTLFGQLGVVVAETDDPSDPLDDACVLFRPGRHQALDGNNIGAIAVGRREQVGGRCLEAHHVGVTVRLHEPGHQGFPFEVNQPGVLTGQFKHVRLRTHGQNAPILDRDRFGQRQAVIHRDDGTIVIDRVRHLCGGHEHPGDTDGTDQHIHRKRFHFRVLNLVHFGKSSVNINLTPRPSGAPSGASAQCRSPTPALNNCDPKLETLVATALTGSDHCSPSQS